MDIWKFQVSDISTNRDSASESVKKGRTSRRLVTHATTDRAENVRNMPPTAIPVEVMVKTCTRVFTMRSRSMMDKPSSTGRGRGGTSTVFTPVAGSMLVCCETSLFSALRALAAKGM
jgi:hypothetical protein